MAHCCFPRGEVSPGAGSRMDLCPSIAFPPGGSPWRGQLLLSQGTRALQRMAAPWAPPQQGTTLPSLSARGGKRRVSCFWKGRAVSAHSQCRHCFAMSMEWEDTQRCRHLPTIVPKPALHRATHQGSYPPPKSLFKKH